jgi:hypothetical protein
MLPTPSAAALSAVQPMRLTIAAAGGQPADDLSAVGASGCYGLGHSRRSTASVTCVPESGVKRWCSR